MFDRLAWKIDRKTSSQTISLKLHLNTRLDLENLRGVPLEPFQFGWLNIKVIDAASYLDNSNFQPSKI